MLLEAFIAPLMMTTEGRVGGVTPAKPPRGRVENPDYRRWASFAPGSWVESEGYQVVDGVRTPLQVKSTLVVRTAHAAIIERDFTAAGAQTNDYLMPRYLFVTAAIDPQVHPTTNAKSRIARLGEETLPVGGRSVKCVVQEVNATEPSRAWGEAAHGKVYGSPEIPGGLVKLELKTKLAGHVVEFVGTATDFRALPLEDKPAAGD